MAPTTFITSLLALTTATIIQASPVPHPTSNFEYVGCVTASLSSFPKHMPFDSTFTAEACLEACIGQAHLVAIGGGCYCDDADDATPVSFELVDEARCDVVCVPEDDASGKCGGDGVFSLWQLPGTEKADCKNKAEVKVVVECPPEVVDCPGRAAAAAPEETIPPVIPTAACPPEGCGEPIPPTPVAQAQQAAANPCPPEGCGEPVPPPTPAAQKQAAANVCPPEGCPPATPVPAPIPAPVPAPAATPAPAPANNSTPGCPPEGCVVPPASQNPAAVLPGCEGDNCEASNASPAQNQDEAADSAAGSSGQDTGAAGEQSDASAGQNDAADERTEPSGEDSGASGEAPALVSESPRLYSSGVLSSIVAIIFGLYLM
ncbi:hypothetical protein N0V84_000710 [Fusarium piperis]|uniref:WSC domain-containing protein n=1 Tax=Fusarium piperis TaxID=1435070 RepID=A0A9W8WN18_9HYPO|nr:hypothetical protein N0V84_000710 [Fusarium piperis]